MLQRDVRLGDDIDDFCVRCKRVMNHAVVSVIAGAAAKVRCRTCHSDHDFRNEQPPPPKIDSRKAALFNEVLKTVDPTAAGVSLDGSIAGIDAAGIDAAEIDAAEIDAAGIEAVDIESEELDAPELDAIEAEASQTLAEAMAASEPVSAKPTAAKAASKPAAKAAAKSKAKAKK
jgi:hypothetical protein